MKNFKIIKQTAVTNSVLESKYFITKSKTVRSILILTSVISMSDFALAREQYDAHTHGIANLTLASENGVLEVQFDSPAISVLGFEHQPSTQEHISTIEKATELLSYSSNVLSTKGTDCNLDTVNVDVIGPAGQALEDEHIHDHAEEKHEKHDDHAHAEDHSNESHKEHDDHGHAQDHSGEKHDDHAHAEGHSDENHPEHDGHEHQSNESHSEVSAIYTFNCKDSEKLTAIDISLFEYFSGIEKIKVNWVTETQQGEAILRPELSTIKFK